MMSAGGQKRAVGLTSAARTTPHAPPWACRSSDLPLHGDGRAVAGRAGHRPRPASEGANNALDASGSCTPAPALAPLFVFGRGPPRRGAGFLLPHTHLRCAEHTHTQALAWCAWVWARRMCVPGRPRRRVRHAGGGRGTADAAPPPPTFFSMARPTPGEGSPPAGGRARPCHAAVEHRMGHAPPWDVTTTLGGVHCSCRRKDAPSPPSLEGDEGKTFIPLFPTHVPPRSHPYSSLPSLSSPDRLPALPSPSHPPHPPFFLPPTFFSTNHGQQGLCRRRRRPGRGRLHRRRRARPARPQGNDDERRPAGDRLPGRPGHAAGAGLPDHAGARPPGPRHRRPARRRPAGGRPAGRPGRARRAAGRPARRGGARDVRGGARLRGGDARLCRQAQGTEKREEGERERAGAPCITPPSSHLFF